MVLPILAFVSGAIGGAIAGCLPRARIAIPLTASAAPIAISLWFTDGLSQFVGFFLALLGATAISLRLITAVFRAIDRHQMRRKQTGVAIG